MKPLVVIESPYADIRGPNGHVQWTVPENVSYARLCLRNSIMRGEAPIASHLLYTQPNVLDDAKSDERKLGIECGLEWLRAADMQVFYTDRGWSTGMIGALLYTCNARRRGKFLFRSACIRIRALHREPQLPEGVPEIDADFLDFLRTRIDPQPSIS